MPRWCECTCWYVHARIRPHSTEASAPQVLLFFLANVYWKVWKVHNSHVKTLVPHTHTLIIAQNSCRYLWIPNWLQRNWLQRKGTMNGYKWLLANHISANIILQSTVFAFEHCVWTLRIVCGGGLALICGKQLHGPPWNRSVELPLWSHGVL